MQISVIQYPKILQYVTTQYCLSILTLYVMTHNKQVGMSNSQVVTPCGVVAGYQRFGGPSCLHLKMGRWLTDLFSLWILKTRRGPKGTLVMILDGFLRCSLREGIQYQDAAYQSPGPSSFYGFPKTFFRSCTS